MLRTLLELAAALVVFLFAVVLVTVIAAVITAVAFGGRDTVRGWRRD